MTGGKDKGWRRKNTVVGTDYSEHDRRRHERGTVPVLSVQFDGQVCETVNWSFGGFMTEGYHGRLTPGALFTIEAIGAAGGELTPVEIRARVVRVKPEDRQLVVSLLTVDDRAYEVLQRFMNERLKLMRDQQTPI